MRGSDVRAQPRRAARGGADRRARCVRARLRRRPARALPQGRRDAPDGRAGRTRSAPAATRAGPSPSRSSAWCSARAVEPVAVTAGNDVSSRDIEGANPLYIPQAKVYAGACAIGPALAVPDDWDAAWTIRLQIADGNGRELFAGETSTSKMKRASRRARRVGRPRQPAPARIRPADRHRPRPAGRLHPRARPRDLGHDRRHRHTRQHCCDQLKG